jgi:hypothetical protein
MGAPLALAAALGLAAAAWQPATPMPAPRSEVAATAYAGGIAIVAGYGAGCESSRRVDLYLPASNAWRRLPSLPVALNHPTAVTYRGRLYVTGGYGNAPGSLPRGAYVLDGRRWRALRPLPAGRAAAASGIVNGKWYLVGGVGPGGHVTRMLVYDFRSGRWSSAPGPTPRQHLGAVAAAGKVYVVGGRIGGPDRNLDVFEAYDPATRRWTTLAPVPEARGGTGLAAVGSLLVSVGGETPTQTLAKVYAFDIHARQWRQLDDLPHPRHGLALVGMGKRVYAIAGGETPGCSQSPVNEVLNLGP